MAVTTENLKRALCFLGGSLGAIGIVAWLVPMKRVLTVFPDLPPMMPNSAIAILLLGIAGILIETHMPRPRQFFVTAAALLVLAVSIGTIVEYALDTRLFLDQFARNRIGPYYPAPSAPPTAVALALVSIAMVLFGWGAGKRFRPSHWMFLIAAFIAFTALVGYLYGATPHHRITGAVSGALPPSIRLIRVADDVLIIGMSFSTAVALLLVSAGLFIGSTDSEGITALAAKGPGGILLRRLAPLAILVPVGFGAIASRLPGTRDSPVLLAGLTDMGTIPLLALFGFTAVRLNRLHDSLEKARDRIRKLFDLASDGVVIADTDGHVTDVNSAACQILGCSRDELLKMSVSDLIVPEEVERLWATRSRLLKGEMDVAEWTILRKGGTRLPVEVSTTILPDGRWQGFLRDIRDRKRAENERRLIAEAGSILATTLDLETTLINFAQLAVRNLADVCIIDIAGGSDKTRRLRVTCRDPAKVHLSYETAPIADGEIRQPLLVEDATETERDLFSVLDIDNPDCTSEPCSVMLVPLQAQGNYLGLLLLISLRHSRKFGTQDLHLAEAIAQRAALSMETAILYQTATQATRSRDEMLGIVAHDLRNPLQIISVDARVLRQQSSEAASEIGAEIGKAAMRMNRLIQDLLDITRIETGHLALRQEWISIGDFVREVIDTQETLASSAAVNIQSTVPPDSPKIWADRDRLNQIFENLIGNAIKFSKPGGLITLGVKAENAEIVFSIADTGAGIAPSDLDHVFDRFWQAHKTKRSGAGLGLAIVKGLVQAHGGRVWVQSTLDKGSTFFFAMPTAASEHQSLINPAAHAAPTRPRFVEEAA